MKKKYIKSGVLVKKSLGQHFLCDEKVSQDIAEAVGLANEKEIIVEIGPGRGALTDFLLGRGQLCLIEVDKDLIAGLEKKYGGKAKIIQEDFLRVNLEEIGANHRLIIAGNLPYNISSQIFFKLFAYRHIVDRIVCMVQHETAERLVSSPKRKTYGILSVLLEAFYKREYLFKVPPSAFKPQPKVQSGVIRLERNKRNKLDCDEKLFVQVVKLGFGQRRKMLRNALHPLGLSLYNVKKNLLSQRAEELSVDDFVELTSALEQEKKNKNDLLI